MFPKTESEFYESSIHLIYAVVVAQGFLIANKIFLPLSNLSQFTYANNAIAVIFAYFFLATAWFGFFKSVKEFPHTKKKIAIPRYATGLFNTFILYYLISITSPDHPTKYGDIILLVVIFIGLLLLAHILKLFEYKNYRVPQNSNNEEKIIDDEKNIVYKIASMKHLVNTIIVTAFVFLLLIIVNQEYVIYYNKMHDWKILDIPLWDPIFLGAVTAIIIWYRYHLWKKSRNYETTLDGIGYKK